MKKLNHYVWKNYLKPWCNKNGKIICKKDGKIIEVNTNKIAAENYFYKLKKITNNDLKFIEKVFLNEENTYIYQAGKEILKEY